MPLIRSIPLLLLLVASNALALIPPEPTDLHDLEFRHSDLWWSSVYQQLDELPLALTESARSDLDTLGVHHQRAFLDPRTGRWGTLILTRSLIPGTGVGNHLRWSDFNAPAPRDHYQLMEAAGAAFLRFLAVHEFELGFASQELTAPRMQVHGDDRIQMYLGRSIDGVPVRDSYIIANINSGNLILMGQRNWADMNVSSRPSLSATEAESVLQSHLRGLQPGGFRESPSLELIPVSDQPDHTRITGIGEGLQYRLVWVLTPMFRNEIGSWEAQVDAHTGELVAFVDTNHYHSEGDDHGVGDALVGHVGGSHSHGRGDAPSRGIVGGIFPVSNDGQAPDGVELPAQPMPFANVRLNGISIGFTTTGGNAPTSASGSLSTTLAGQYVTINSSCGTVNVSGTDNDLDLGDGASTNCAVPAGTSAGNTNASRTVFYGIGRINEQARGYLPNNNWLNSPITGRTNVAQTCNATWSTGTNTATFYNSGSGCSNTGEVMAVVHHEWGHGMDANSVNPGISRPGEGIADIYAQNMLNDSCIGRNFRPGQNCTGFGDACLQCTGVRESDWALQQSGQPHDIDWILSSCPSGSGTPCGRSTHCEGSVVAEAIWDLVHRDLQGFDGSPLDYDLNTALELGTRLTYEGAGAVGNWYQCTNNNGGCNADGGYLQYLAADAVNGTLENGTPHMSAIFAAFDRHQLACSQPIVQNSGCETGPADAPSNLNVTNLNEGAALSWDPVDEADEYWVYRTEGPMGCDFGKARVGQVSGTTFTETGLRNGFDVYYSVIAVGSGASCTGPMTPCVTATPAQGPSGTLQGTITRGGSSAPLVDVVIDVVGDISLGATTDQDGNFSLSVLEGEYEVIVSRSGFETASQAGVVVIEGETTVVNLVLDAPIMETATSEVNVSVGEGGAISTSLAIDNAGTAALEWTLQTDLESLRGGREFEGDFDISNWELINSPTNTGGSVSTEAGPPIELYVIGGNANVGGDTDFQIEIPSDGTITFDWGYQSSDTGQFDSGGYVINGDFTVLAFNSSQVPFFNETTTVEVSAGDVFAFRVNTEDGLFGEGTLGVTNFEFEADICGTPGGVSWLSVDPESGTVAPGESGLSSLLVDASGLTQGDYEAFLCLGSNDPTLELSVIPVLLTVTDQDPAVLEVDPTVLAFGEVTLGDDAMLAFTVSNTADAGAMSLELSTLALSGDGEFAITGGDCALGTQLEPGESCTVEVTFTPSDADTFSGEVAVATADGQSDVVSLSGEGAELVLGPEAEITPASFSFTVNAGDVTDDLLNIANVAASGAKDLNWSIDTDELLSVGGRFDGDFDINNWTFENSPAGVNGSFSTEAGPPIELYITGGDDGVGGNSDLWIEVPFDGTITFDWGYQSTDTGEFDSGGYVINGDYTVLAFNNTQEPFFNETATVAVSAGDIFAFRVWTDDGDFGPGELGVTNFAFTAELCSPAAGASWLTATPNSGSTAAGSSDAVTVNVNTAGLGAGQYTGALCVTTNDPQAELVVVPVSLEVLDDEVFFDRFEDGS